MELFYSIQQQQNMSNANKLWTISTNSFTHTNTYMYKTNKQAIKLNNYYMQALPKI